MKKPNVLQDDFNLYKRLLGYVKPHAVMFIVAILGSVAYASIDSGVTYLFKPLLDKGFIGRDLWYIKWVPIFVMGAFLFRGVAGIISEYCMAWVARTVVMTFRQRIFTHLLRLPSHYYDNNSSGQLISKLLFDVEQIAKASTDAVTNLVQSAALIVGLIIVMFTINWRLALIYLITAPLIAWIVRYSSKRVRRYSRSMQDAMKQVTEVAEESIEGYRVVKTFGGMDYETAKFVDATEESRRRNMKAVMTKAWSVSAVQFTAACGISFIIYLAISPISATLLTAGGFVSMMIAMLALLKPMKTLTTVNSVIQRGLAGAQSVFSLLDEPLEEDTGTQCLARAKGELRFKQINFTYQTTGQQVLYDIHFDIQPGQTVALVGRSGSGKSTLVSLLPRFYELNSGLITLDGVDIRDITLRSLRDQLAIVTQQVTLFNDTIERNIAYGCCDHVATSQILAAAQAAHATEFIDQFPNGLKTMIGENGVLLSGGQRQRVAIARAILKDAPILILDEATSALDTESERHIQAALEAVMQNRTTLVIAHRLSTVEKADLILVMDEGRIVERGTHADLLQQQGYYAKLNRMQFSEQSISKQKSAIPC